METIKPHGRHLVNRIANIDESELKGLDTVEIDLGTTLDLELIATGAYSPLEGFMRSDDYTAVVERMRLSDYIPWSLPITLSVSEDKAKKLEVGDDIALSYNGGEVLGLLSLEEKYGFNKKWEAENVFKTADTDHPGVAYLMSKGDVNLGGKIQLVKRMKYADYAEYRFDPADTRGIFSDLGWRTVVGFQTRNPIHRAHEYVTKCALEMVDGLFINPLVGSTKSDDIPADTRMKCYKAIIEHYYPKDRTLLGLFPAAMRYAGPREAVFHALVRKNYGCTHFTVGRDHAGVGNYYGTFDAQKIFYEFEPCEIGIIPLFFEHVFYCKECGHMASMKTCDHSQDKRVFLSGTKVRELLAKNEMLPLEFTRPEVAKVLIDENHRNNPEKSVEADQKA
ncbi:MAG TPA: sulfate adenylyltransferase [Euryarchaeota archaeon]|nr:sulfate adenylyltransferase [archaeon BMS3Abin16]GBE56426.1 sulfate adenylyltransferase [archaeon BMS3Bbin16]HDH28371.1 sulfate adenylyltransferase [Euryarchaeota archaeon]HDY74771.1 sulfate adenylyltransferase [Euryarchaeota archaeon]